MPDKVNTEHWDIVIEGKKSSFSLNYKELWNYRDLIVLFAKRDIATVYNQTILGPLWFFIQPLLTSLLFIFIFGNVANIKTGPIPGMLFYLSGLTVWNYFTSCINTTSSTFIANVAIFGKVYFPRIVMPISKILSGLFIFFTQFILFILFLLFWIFFKGYQFQPSPYLLLIPLLLLILAGLGLGIGIIIASLTTKYRDLTYLVAFGVQLLMYLTPVIYPLSSVTGKMRLVIISNPVSAVIESFRYSFFPVGDFQWHHLIYSAVVMVAFLFLGLLLFNRIEKNFMDTV
jgi:lipopolysaccharide transport system permease protein